MQTEETQSEEKEIPEEAQETLDRIKSPVLQAAEGEGMTLDQWMKLLCNLARNAKTKKPQKLTGEVDESKLKVGVKQIAKSNKEGVVLITLPDNDTRFAALREIGRATGYSTKEEDEVDKAPIIILNAPDRDAVKVIPEGEGT